MSLEDKIKPTVPKKLLALDGGGIRGVITLQFLRRIEQALRDQSGKPNLVLSDYFDYIAGTSTGAIIATCISLGMSIDQIETYYISSGPAMFSKDLAIWRLWMNKFKRGPLAKKLAEVMGTEATLGDAPLKTLLMLVLRNATTDSPWPLSNNPNAIYNDLKTRGDKSNLHLPLWQLVRASTAAPTYFPPEEIEISGQKHLFVDGGVTMYNNPAFQLFLMATLEPYKLEWQTGEDKMLLISVGTGTSDKANKDLKPGQMNLLYQAGSVPSALMLAAQIEQDFLCRTFGRALAGDRIDREIGTLIPPAAQQTNRLFTYARYNVRLETDELKALGCGDIQPAHVQQMDSVDHIEEMKRVGEAAAKQKVEARHFAGFPA